MAQRNGRLQTMNKTKARQRLLIIWQSYVKESEQQDGKNYWSDHFERPEEAVEDFILWYNNGGASDLWF